MKIIIKRKLQSIEDHEGLQIKYDWGIIGEEPNERVADLHLFCLSIVKDLLEESFKTHQEGIVSYGKVHIQEETIKDIKQLYDDVAFDLLEDVLDSDKVKNYFKNLKN